MPADADLVPTTRNGMVIAEDLDNALCSECRNINMESISLNSHHRLLANLSTLSRAKAGCPFCRIVFPGWKDGLPSVGDDHGFAAVTGVRAGTDVKVVEGFRGLTNKRELVFIAAEGDPASKLIWRRPPLTRFDSEACFTMARQWIRECMNSHPKCVQALTTRLPTRLVHVGSDNQDPSLYIPPVGAQGIYAALSYCWGPVKQPVMLIRAKLGSVSYRYPFEELPATLRDVILICRRLDIEYVWIDALCIVQDSPNAEDWIRESANMANIYGGAALTIAASAAKQVTDGILSASFPPVDFNCVLPYNLGNGQSGMVYVLPFKRARPQFNSKVNSAPLEKRAWCLQERLLSPRILKFEESQLAWECSTTIINANGPLTKPKNLQRPSWKNIIEDFTARSLTYTSDKLPALSGYAKHIHSLTRDFYLAGLWKEDLVAQLLWWIDIRLSVTDSRPVSYRAPSWSWASVDYQVHFHNGDPLAIDVVDASVPVFNADPFGQVDTNTRGYLKLRGWVMREVERNSHYRFHNDDGKRYVSLFSGLGSQDIQDKTDNAQSTLSQDSESLEPYQELSNDIVPIGGIYPDSWEDINSNARTKGPLSVLRITKIYGLLLVPTSVPLFKETVFRRIGLLEILDRTQMELFGQKCSIQTITII
ncbi:heterokaryon incompatibility protein-domain-containing protein [Xylogone sp. PMI_703]|nr:heterokaryon incompatibility protein-domain-containing protein [Xylogone sp. PMI_703]